MPYVQNTGKERNRDLADNEEECNMPQEPGNDDGPFELEIPEKLTIYINARSVLWDKPTISFAQVVEQWNKARSGSIRNW